MARRPTDRTATPVGGPGQAPIPVPVDEDGREAVAYFADSEAADAAMPPGTVERALALFGAWSDLDRDDAIKSLDRIRHESKPTPPIDDL